MPGDWPPFTCNPPPAECERLDETRLAVPPGDAGDQLTLAAGSPPGVKRIWLRRADASTVVALESTPCLGSVPSHPGGSAAAGLLGLDTGNSDKRDITLAIASAFVPSGRLYFCSSDSRETTPGVPTTGVAEDMCPVRRARANATPAEVPLIDLTLRLGGNRRLGVIFEILMSAWKRRPTPEDLRTFTAAGARGRLPTRVTRGHESRRR